MSGNKKTSVTKPTHNFTLRGAKFQVSDRELLQFMAEARGVYNAAADVALGKLSLNTPLDIVEGSDRARRAIQAAVTKGRAALGVIGKVPRPEGSKA
jgi:hypothetical protein